MPTPNNPIVITNDRNLLCKTLLRDNAFVLTDSNVISLYPALFSSVKNVYAIDAGESAKTLSNAEVVLRKMAECGLDRQGAVVSVGGGVVGDLGGFVASVFMRGIDWINIPTTLLAQVDSGIGGKCGVNLDSIKNLVGSFHNPINVYIDTNFLLTLNEREWRCGIGEVIKTSLLNAELFDYVCENFSALSEREPAVVRHIVDACVRIKDDIVRLDFKESSLRRVLNIGHTLGHALETADNYALSHGEYVMLGIYMESFAFSELIEGEYLDKIRQLLKKAVLNTASFEPKRLVELAQSDKKNSGGLISFVIPVSVGQTTQLQIDADELIKRIEKCKFHL